MRRGSPLQRWTKLAAKRWGVKKDPAETRRRRARDRGQYADQEHLRIVRNMDCCAARWMNDAEHCAGPIDPHHAGLGLSTPDPERRKTCDRTAIPMCRYHHGAVETLTGCFRSWDKEFRRAWYDDVIPLVQGYVHLRRAA